MSAFDFSFTLFGLVLGLAMAEVLAGFGRVLKARSAAPDRSTKIRIGWLTPMIGLLVTLDLVSTWQLAWNSRQNIPITFAVLIGGTIVTAVYYIAATLVWPDKPANWPDLDDWFDRHKGQIGGAIALANVGFSAVQWLAAPAPVPLVQYLYIGLAASLTVTRRRWQSGVALAGMLTLILLYAADLSF
jgi:hypothetical protein